jgi:RNA polymerase sigma-70 factor (ECF subfamily)
MSDATPSGHTRPSLLLRVRDARDTEAWQAFVDIYGPLVYRAGRRRGLQDADAADFMQEVLTEVAQGMRTFQYQPERGRFRDWLGTVTRRKLTRFCAKKQRGAAAAGGDATLNHVDAPAADPEWIDAFNAHLVAVALERIRGHFEPTTWRAFERAWRDNQSAAQTASELQVPIEAVYLAKSRVLKRLEEEILVLAEDVPQFSPLG